MERQWRAIAHGLSCELRKSFNSKRIVTQNGAALFVWLSGLRQPSAPLVPPTLLRGLALIHDRLVDEDAQLAMIVHIPGWEELSEVNHNEFLLGIDPVA